MGFIKQAIADAKESEAVPEGEYDLRIISAVLHKKKGTEDGDIYGSVKCVIGIDSADHPNAAPFQHYVPLVTGEEDDAGKVNMKLVMQRRFLELFNIPYEDDGFDPDDMPGATCTGKLGQEMVEEGANGQKLESPYPRNNLILPRLKSEESESRGAKSGSKSSSSSKPGAVKKKR
jgi:hypothetical protein